jgi:hypothetical protein
VKGTENFVLVGSLTRQIVQRRSLPVPDHSRRRVIADEITITLKNPFPDAPPYEQVRKDQSKNDGLGPAQGSLRWLEWLRESTWISAYDTDGDL